jgi:predicted GNAT superfamily acetyltransferase
MDPVDAAAPNDGWAVAREAAKRAGVVVAPLTSLDDADAVNDVIERVWGAQHLHRELIRALEHSGNALVGAREGDGFVGFALGFAGTAGGLHLHSHMAAVVPELQHRGVGYALKLAQRAACLDAGIPEIRWTYDPLVARNGRFNLVKLGAVATAFWPEFYGTMSDRLNAGDRSDRFEVVWRLRSERAERALAGRPEEPADGRVLLAMDERERPYRASRDDATGDVVLVAVPRDHTAMKARDPELAAQWRRTAAEAFRECFDAGLVATAMTPDSRYAFRPDKEAT